MTLPSNPAISIITPTLQRQSLVRCCESVDAQAGGPYEHIVMVDCERLDMLLLSRVERPGRTIVQCNGAPHRNWGNSCRHAGWAYAHGEWIIHLDDDNYLADSNILLDITTILANVAHWAIFPMLRHGHWFYNNPPDMCMTDTGNIVARREIGRWPDTSVREADGLLVQSLRAVYPYAAFPNFRPIIVMEQSSGGV